MIAALLKTSDGDFAYGPAFGALMFFWLAGFTVWLLIRAIRKGSIPFGYAGTMGSSITWIERAKNPVGFWIVFLIWSCLFLPFCVLAIYDLCTGYFTKSASR